MSTATLEKRRSETTSAERIHAGRVYSPAVDIIETPDELLVLADVPGDRAESIDIQFEQGELTISAPVEGRQPQNTRYFAMEYGIGDYQRIFRIGEAIDSERIHAEFLNGVLTLHLPKSAQAKPRKIAVKTR